MPAGNLREAQVIYKELLKEIEKLGYREKLHLAQRLLQMAIKEEEEQKPESAGPVDPGMVEFVAERLRKLKPSRKDAVLNSIGAMFQFRGGISEEDKEKMFSALMDAREIVVTETGKITYPEK